MIAHMAPETAARLLDDVTDETLRSQSIGRIANAWAQSDSGATRKWVTSLPSGPSRDQALMGMLGAGTASADDALSLIRPIQSPQLRQSAVLNAATHFASTDREEMRTFLRRYPLDPQSQQQLDLMLKAQETHKERGW